MTNNIPEEEIPKKILIVEDLPAAYEVLARKIQEKNENYTIEIIDNLDALKTNLEKILSWEYDLVFLDGELYWNNTKETLCGLLQQWVTTPIVNFSWWSKLNWLGLIELWKPFNTERLDTILSNSNLEKDRWEEIKTRQELVNTLLSTQKESLNNDGWKKAKEPNIEKEPLLKKIINFFKS